MVCCELRHVEGGEFNHKLKFMLKKYKILVVSYRFYHHEFEFKYSSDELSCV